MKYLLALLTALTIISCGTETTMCEDYTFQERISYQGNVAYHFGGLNYFKSEDTLDLNKGETYCVVLDGVWIIDID